MRHLTIMFCPIIICVLFLVNGCNPGVIPLKSKYNDKPLEITTTKPIDSVWSSLNDMFARNGLPIKKIDKKNGLIRTKKIRMNSIYTFEDKDGQLQDPQAWVVLMKDFNNGKQWQPRIIYGQWSVVITESEKGKTIIKIDPVVVCTYYANSFTKVESPGQSTGKFEALLQGYLEHN